MVRVCLLLETENNSVSFSALRKTDEIFSEVPCADECYDFRLCTCSWSRMTGVYFVTQVAWGLTKRMR